MSMTDGRKPFFRFLDSVGNGTGTKNMATTADSYFLTAGAGERLYLARMIVSYRDGLGGNVAEYGNLNAALSTGIIVRVNEGEGGVRTDLTDGVPIQTNGDWGRFCYDHQRLDYGAGDDLWLTRWTFEKSGRPIILDNGDSLEMVVQDSLVGLVDHYAMIQGYVL